MLTVNEYLRDKAEWYLDAITAAPPAARPSLQMLGNILCGHLDRLRAPPPELIGRLHEQKGAPDADAAIELFTDTRESVTALAQSLDQNTYAEGELEDLEDQITEGFYDVLDALILATDAADETVRRAGRDLFDFAITEISAFAAAKTYALAFDEAYKPGTDFARLFVRAVVQAAEDAAKPLEETLEVLFEESPVQPLSWHVRRWRPAQSAQPTKTLALAAQNKDKGRRLSVSELRKCLLSVDWWYVPHAPQPIRLDVVKGEKNFLYVYVYAEELTADERADAQPSPALDAWEVRVRMEPVRLQTGPAGGTPLAAGQARFLLKDSVDPAAFRVEFRPPDGDWSECYGTAIEEE